MPSRRDLIVFGPRNFALPEKYNDAVSIELVFDDVTLMLADRQNFPLQVANRDVSSLATILLAVDIMVPVTPTGAEWLPALS